MPERSEGSNTVAERAEGSHTVSDRSEGLHTVPERSEGSHTVPTSSDEGYGHICESCSGDGVIKEAKNYCQDCGKKICETCKDYHKKLVETRNHIIVPIIKSFVTVREMPGYNVDTVTETVLFENKFKTCTQVNDKTGDDKKTPDITVMTNILLWYVIDRIKRLSF